MKSVLRHIKRACLTALVVMALALTSVQLASAQQAQDGRWENGVSEPWWFADDLPKAEIATAQSRWQQIGLDNESAATDDLTGGYFIGGETHGSYLRWSQQNGFVLLHVDKCAARVVGFSYGQVVASPTLIQLAPETAAQAAGSHGHTHQPAQTMRFVPVRWRGVPYLVAESEMGDFGDYVAGLNKFAPNQFGIFTDGISFFIRMGSRETGTADDSPIVPPGYERFIKRPIEARITAVGPRVVKRRPTEANEDPYYESETQVTVNVGRANGIQPGMMFYVLDSDAALQELVEIRRAGLRSSGGVIVRTLKEHPRANPAEWKDDTELQYPPVTAGWKLTTSAHKNFDRRLEKEATTQGSTPNF